MLGRGRVSQTSASSRGRPCTREQLLATVTCCMTSIDTTLCCSCRQSFTPPTSSLTAIPGTVLLLSPTSPATLLADSSGVGTVLLNSFATFSADYPPGVACTAASVAQGSLSATASPTTSGTASVSASGLGTSSVTASSTTTASPTATPSNSLTVDAWVTGAVRDASDASAPPLVGVKVTGSRGWVFTGVDGSFALYAPVVGDRVVVSAGGLPGYSSTTGTAKHDSGVSAYTIPLSLTPFSVQVSFDPAAGLAPVSVALPSGAFSNNLPYFVSVPAIPGSGLPPSVTVRVAVIHPSTGPGLLEGASAFAPNGVTRLEVRR